MIYLIKSVCKKDKDKELSLDNLKFAYKIGYTSCESGKKRFDSYNTHNPAYEVIKMVPGGDLNLESRLHFKFKHLRIGTEWFEASDEILNYFSSVNTCDDFTGLDFLLSEDILQFIIPVRKILYDRGLTDDDIVSKLLVASVTKDNIYDVISGEFEVLKEDIRRAQCMQDSINKQVSEFYKYHLFENRMRYLCENPEILDFVPEDYYFCYTKLGPAKCKALSYQRSHLLEEYNNTTMKKDVMFIDTIKSSFELGAKYTRAEIKETLRDIYKGANLTAAPKATDICNWFEVEECYIANKSTGKRDKGFIILEIKEKD